MIKIKLMINRKRVDMFYVKKPAAFKKYVVGARFQTITQVKQLRAVSVLGTKVNNMASRVKGLVCLWHHEHGRTYRSHDFSGGGRSQVLVS